MVTTPQKIETPEEKALREEESERAVRRDRIKGAGLTLLTGGTDQPWRRSLLFVIAAFGIALAGEFAVAGAVALVALLLLAYTDRVMDAEVPEE